MMYLTGRIVAKEMGMPIDVGKDTEKEKSKQGNWYRSFLGG